MSSERPRTPTGAFPPGRHPSVDSLADFVEGLLAENDPGLDTSIHAHVTSCSACTDSVGALVAMPGLLASVAAPPIPAEVAISIDAALVRAATERAAERVPARAGAHSHAATAPRARRSVFGRRLAASLLAGAAVVGGGYVLATGLPLGSSRPGILANGVTSHPPQSTIETIGGPTPGTSIYDSEVTAAELSDQVLRVAADEAEPSSAPAQSQAPPDGDRNFTVRVFPTCVQAVRQLVDEPLGDLVGSATTTYKGQRAVLVVFEEESGAGGNNPKAGGPYTGFVVSSTCLQPTSNTATDVKILDRITVVS